MTQRSTPDFSVFQLRRSDSQLVESAKVDPLAAFLPIALAIIGLTLLFFARSADASDILNLKGAPFEVRVKGLQSRQTLDRSWGDTLNISTLPGQLQGARWAAKLQGLDFEGSGWKLKGAAANVQLDSWKYSSSIFRNGFGMDVECRNATVAFLPGDVDLPLPTSLSLKVKASQGKLVAEPTWDTRAWVDSILQPFFVGDRIEQTLKVEANCSGGLDGLARDLIRARLKDLPKKDPSFYDRVTRDLSESVEKYVETALRDSLPGSPAGVEFETTFNGSRESDGTIVVRSEGTGDFLSPEARALVRPLAGASAAQAIVTPAALNRLAVLGMSAAAAKNGGSYENGRVIFRLPDLFEAKQFAGFIGELSGLPTTNIQLQLALPARVGENANPALRPWVSATGLATGYDLDWKVEMEFVDAKSSKVYASRSIAFQLVFNDLLKNGEWAGLKFAQGKWLQNESAVGNASPELGITLDWFLNSELFRDFMEKQLGRSVNWNELGKFSFRRVGQATINSRRALGGYYAEALVVDVQLKR